MKYIGGDLEINPFDYLGKNSNDAPYLNKYIFYTSGRTALKYILMSIKPKYPILLPGYLCESIILTLEELNLKYEFYKIDLDLKIDFNYLLNKIQENEYSIVIFINYFGFVIDAQYFKKVKKIWKNIIIIEDWSHLSFIPYELNLYNGIGDIIYGSLRKVFAIPDGGYISKNETFDFEEPKSDDQTFPFIKALGKALRYYYVNGKIKDNEVEKIYMELLKLGEKKLDKNIPDIKISTISYSMLKDMNKYYIYEKRRKNYKTLLDLFNNDNDIKNHIELLFMKLKEYDLPYMFPILVKNSKRDLIREKLRTIGIFTSIIWDLPKEIIFDESKEISENILCIPIDQRYNTNDVHEIYFKIKEVINSYV